MLLFLPFLVSDFLYQPFVSGKTVFFTSVVEIITLFYLLLILNVPQYRPRFTPVAAVLALFIGVLFVASVFGVNFAQSLWSSSGRMTGLITLSHLFAFFIIAGSIFKTKKEWIRVFKISLIASFLVAVSAFGQMSQSLLLLGYVTLGIFGSGGTIGNVGFLSSYFLLHIFLGTWLVLTESKRKLQLVWGAMVLFEVFTLFFSETRAALLAFFAGLFVLFFLYILFSQAKKIKLVFASVILLLILLTGVIWLARDGLVSELPGIKDVVQLSLTTPTVVTRLMAWEIAVEGWQERFLLGWGAENFNIVFDKYYNPQFLRYSLSETWFDRAHNVVFETAATAGIVGLASYLMIFVLCGFVLFRAFKRRFLDNHTLIILVTILFIYFFQNLFLFDTINSLLIFFLILGFISYSAFPKRDTQGEPVRNSSHGNAVFKTSALIFIVFLPFLFYQVNIKTTRAMHYTYQGVKHFDARPRLAVDYFKKAFVLNTHYQGEILKQMSTEVANKISNGHTYPGQEEDLLFLIGEMQRDLENNKRSVVSYLALGRMYLLASTFFGHSYMNEVKETVEEALELSPSRHEVYFLLSEFYILNGDIDSAKRVAQDAVYLDETIGESHWNLGFVYIAENDLDTGFEEIEKALDLGYYGADPEVDFFIELSQNHPDLQRRLQEL